MLSGDYKPLVDNMMLTNIIAITLMVLPFLFLFLKEKWLYSLYVISFITNLPLIFMMRFNFSYEVIIAACLVLKNVIKMYKLKTLKYSTTKHSMILIMLLFMIIIINLFTSFFHFNKSEFIIRLVIYIVNIFIFFAFTYFFDNQDKLYEIRNAVLIGAFLLALSMIIEMFYGYYGLGVARLRPAGLLLDPNVAAFTLNICLIFSFFQKETLRISQIILNILIRVFILFGVLLTVSRSGYIGSVVILVFLLFHYSGRKKAWIPTAVVISFMITFFCFYNIMVRAWNTLYEIIDLKRVFPIGISGSTGGTGIPSVGEISPFHNERISLLISAIKLFFRHVFFGVGIGNVASGIEFYSGVHLESHNTILQLLAESGIVMGIALIGLGLYIWKFIKAAPQKNKWFIVLIFLVIASEAMFNHNLLNINIIWFTIAFIVSICALYSKTKKTLTLRILS